MYASTFVYRMKLHVSTHPQLSISEVALADSPWVNTQRMEHIGARQIWEYNVRYVCQVPGFQMLCTHVWDTEMMS